MKATKKCPNCGQWSSWNHNPDDRCEHCHALLDPSAAARQQDRQDRQEEEQKRFSVDFIQIDPTESWYKQLFKRVGLAFQIAFVAIISFILWLIAFLAG